VNGYDIRTIQVAPEFSACMDDSRFRSIITPHLKFDEEHGAISNYVTITNESQFTAHNIRVKVEYYQEKEQRAKPREFSLTFSRLRPGKSETQRDVFRDAPWFGSGITMMQHYLRCDQDVRLSPPPNALPVKPDSRPVPASGRSGKDFGEILQTCFTRHCRVLAL